MTRPVPAVATPAPVIAGAVPLLHSFRGFPALAPIEHGMPGYRVKPRVFH